MTDVTLGMEQRAVLCELLATVNLAAESDSEAVRCFGVILLLRMRNIYRGEAGFYFYSDREIEDAVRMVE